MSILRILESQNDHWLSFIRSHAKSLQNWALDSAYFLALGHRYQHLVTWLRRRSMGRWESNNTSWTATKLATETYRNIWKGGLQNHQNTERSFSAPSHSYSKHQTRPPAPSIAAHTLWHAATRAMEQSQVLKGPMCGTYSSTFIRNIVLPVGGPPFGYAPVLLAGVSSPVELPRIFRLRNFDMLRPTLIHLERKNNQRTCTT